MTTSPAPFWVHDGFTFDLTRAWHDVFGHRWEWTGETTADGPLMRAVTDRPDLTRTVMPLSEVYVMFGPLTPAPAPLTAADVRAILATEDRDPQCMACHDIGCTACVRPPLPARPVLRSPAATAGTATVSEPKPAEPDPAVTLPSPSTFACFLARIRGGAR
jgi:hypothetical protein